jgi:tellurite methyltransferase
VLDYGCGLGNLAIAAARRGCSVLALDASASAIRHLVEAAAAERLDIEAREADLARYELAERFDCVLSIGLLMFFDCPSALQQLAALQSALRPGGVAVINVLVRGTTYMDMFDPNHHCLLAPETLQRGFAGWRILLNESSTYPAPRGLAKCFVTVIAQRPDPAGSAPAS